MKTNNPRKKITKREYYRRLRHWQFQRAKGLEEWNKKRKSRTRGSKYKKYKVLIFWFWFWEWTPASCPDRAYKLEIQIMACLFQDLQIGNPDKLPG